jgi:predicted DCC family thiol-disulfide oxidoreductase YuxK
MDFETIVFINNSVVFTKSEAIIEVARYLDGWWKFITFIKIFPSFLRDGLYSKIAKNRYNWFGKKEGCMVPSKDINNRFLI